MFSQRGKATWDQLQYQLTHRINFISFKRPLGAGKLCKRLNACIYRALVNMSKFTSLLKKGSIFLCTQTTSLLPTQ